MFCSRCSGAVRLSNGFQRKAGLVEVFLNSSWVPVADDNWSASDARVVCRQLGYSEVAGVLGVADLCPIASSTGELVVGNVSCSGEERMLTDCPHSLLLQSQHLSPSGVVCAGEEGS